MRLMPIALGAVLTVPAPAIGQELKPLLDLRLRHEHVEQEGRARSAEASTMRARGGLELKSGAWSLLAEIEATATPVGKYDSGVNHKALYPLVADPENTELNRLQLQYRPAKTVLTLGRQRVNLVDERFIGSVGWRENEQTFDAVRIEHSPLERVKADLTYAWSTRTIWGVDGDGARQQAVSGTNIFAGLSYAAPVGTLTGFSYIVDQDEEDVQGFRLSSRTFGLRFAGSRQFSPSAKLHYAASYARQSDHHRNPNRYRADYHLLDARLELRDLTLGLGHETLGADDGRPLTSFQTPLATLHKFQGWADKFTVTPPNGVRDLYASVGYRLKTICGLDSLAAAVVWHRFDSDRAEARYGTEWDAMLSAKRGRWTATAKLADYDAQAFATDTRKAWLQLEWSY